MSIALYVIIGVVVVLWLLGITGIVAAGTGLTWLLLIVAIALIMVAVLTGGRL